MEYLVEARNLSKRYGSFVALKKVNISIKKGDIYGLIGDNGAGKTTFLKMICGQSFPSEGEITLFGAHQQGEQEKRRKRTGVIVELPGFYPQLTIAQNMEYYRIQKGIPGKDVVEKVLKTTCLWEVRKKKGKALSLGMKQRLGLAIALMGEPELLILDEPINGLDPSGIIEMRNLLKKLNQEKNMTIIISSHILSELEQLATMYGFLDKGQLLEEISASNLHEKCGNYLEIVVSDTEKYTALLEKHIKKVQYLVLPDKTIHIFQPEQEIEKYSQLASENGIGIRTIMLKQKTLEDYYMNLKKEGRK